MKKTTVICITTLLLLIFSPFAKKILAFGSCDSREANQSVNSNIKPENIFVLKRSSSKTNGGKNTLSLESSLFSDQLFYRNKPKTTINRSLTLGELFFLDRLFNNPENKILDQNRTSLGDILILNQLFTGGNPIILGKYFSNTQLSIGDLMILNRLFGQDINFISNGTIIGNLLILNRIFQPYQKVSAI